MRSVERLLKVTAFTVSVYSCVYRPFLPFRSPAGETGEIVAPDKGIRAIGEKARRMPRAAHCCLRSKSCTVWPSFLESMVAVLLRDQNSLLRLWRPTRASGPSAKRRAACHEQHIATCGPIIIIAETHYCRTAERARLSAEVTDSQISGLTYTIHKHPALPLPEIMLSSGGALLYVAV